MVQTREIVCDPIKISIKVVKIIKNNRKDNEHNSYIFQNPGLHKEFLQT
jgi:hypothetical protein